MTNHSVETGWSKYASLAWIGLIVVAAMGVRVQIAHQESFWLDELHTGWVVADSFEEVWTRAAEGNQTPLYFWLTYLSGNVFGMTELPLRLVSLSAGLGLLLTSVWIIRRWTGSWIGGGLTVSLIAISDPFLFYQTEARPYALLQWLSLLQVISFLALLRCLVGTSEPTEGSNEVDLGAGAIQEKLTRVGQPSSWSLAGSGFVITSLAMAYTHLTGVLIAIPELIFGLFFWLTHSLRRGSQLKLNRLWLPIGCVILGCLPLLQGVHTVMGRTENWGQVASLELLVDQHWRHWLVWILIPVVMLIGRGIVKPGEVDQATEPDRNEPMRHQNGASEATWLVAIWAVAIPISIGLIDGLQWAPLALSRYLAVGIVAGPLLTGLWVGNLPTLISRFIVAALLLMASLGMQYDANQWWVRSVEQGGWLPLRTETWRESIASIGSDTERLDYPVLLFGAVIEDEAALRNRESRFQQYLQFPVRSIYPLENASQELGTRFVFAGPTINQVHFAASEIERVERAGGAWLLVRHRDEIAREIIEELLRKTDADWSHVNLFASPDSLVLLVAVDLPTDE